jgi:hypothetical protein
MKTLNFCLWSAGLLLQAILLIRLVRLRLLLRMPVFTLLIAFYVARSLTLYLVHLDAMAYNHLKEILSLADLILQIALAIEIMVYALGAGRPTTRRRRLRVTSGLAGGAALAAVFALAVPERGRIPFDRGIVFTTLLMLFVLLWMILARIKGPHRRVAEGFTLYGIVAILAGVARNFAVLRRSQTLLLGASYTQSGIYLLIVLYWILTIRAAGRKLPAKN